MARVGGMETALNQTFSFENSVLYGNWLSLLQRWNEITHHKSDSLPKASAQSFVQWSNVLSTWEDYGTNSEWWASPYRSRPIFLGTINRSFTMQRAPNQCWRRSQVPLPIISFEKVLPKTNGVLLILTRMIILLTSWRNLFQVGIRGINLLWWSYIILHECEWRLGSYVTWTSDNIRGWV